MRSIHTVSGIRQARFLILERKSLLFHVKANFDAPKNIMNSKHIKSIFFILVFLLSNSISHQAQNPTLDPRFGIVETIMNPQAATEAGAGYSRIILRWDVFQPNSPDEWQPANVPDPMINQELADGREVVAILIATPHWASKGMNDSRAVPDMVAWGKFVHKVATHYQGKIKHWIIWNEPDVWDHNHPGNTWLGTEIDYAELLKTAYGSIKVVDPDMQVHIAGLTYHWDREFDREQYLARLLHVIASDPRAEENNFYFDGIGYHLYYRPYQAFLILTEIRSILYEYNLDDKPIWINETNAPPTDDHLEPPWAEPLFIVSSQEQAAYIIQAHALMLAGGAERIEVYKMQNSLNHPEDVEPFGLVRSDGSRRLAFHAYRVVTKHFADYVETHWLQQGNIYVVTLDRDGKTTTILWNTSQHELLFTLNAIAEQALLVDEVGNEQVIMATDGSYTLRLPEATCTAGECLVGGMPRLLIEDGSPNQRLPLVQLSIKTESVSPIVTTTLEITPSHKNIISSAMLITSSDVISDTDKNNVLVSKLENINWYEFFTPYRVLVLVVLGTILFTVIYGMQFMFWTKRDS